MCSTRWRCSGSPPARPRRVCPQGWADVYYFCGRRLQYCTCGFRWNARGWAKAYILWSFVLSSAAGLQRVVIQLGLNGLLPGAPRRGASKL